MSEALTESGQPSGPICDDDVTEAGSLPAASLVTIATITSGPLW